MHYRSVCQISGMLQACGMAAHLVVEVCAVHHDVFQGQRGSLARALHDRQAPQAHHITG